MKKRHTNSLLDPIRPLRLLAALLLVLAVTDPLPAQHACPDSGDCDEGGVSGQRGSGPGVILGLNVLAGGITGGLLQEIHGGSFLDGFRKGAVGGAMIFAGKRLAVESFAGAGLAGREVAAVGGSMVRNAGAARALLSELVLPLGPSRLYVRPRGDRPVALQVDAAALVVLGAMMLDDRYSLDASASLSAGMPVFRQRDDLPAEHWAGRTRAGVISLSRELDAEPPAARQRVWAHERVHVLQYDQGFMMLGEPLERTVLPLLPGGVALSRYVDVGLELPLWALAHRMIEYQQRPWEREADLLSGTSGFEARSGPPGSIEMGGP